VIVWKDGEPVSAYPPVEGDLAAKLSAHTRRGLTHPDELPTRRARRWIGSAAARAGEQAGRVGGQAGRAAEGAGRLAGQAGRGATAVGERARRLTRVGRGRRDE
jgi:hypothetical protein